MSIAYFGLLDCNNLDHHYSTEITIDSLQIEIDINFQIRSISNIQVDKLNATLKNLKPLIDKTRYLINADYKTGAAVKEYISFHLDNVFTDNLDEILKETDTTLPYEERLLATLKLRRISLYPSSHDYLVFDYVINEELSDYILVININKDFNLEYITMES